MTDWFQPFAKSIQNQLGTTHQIDAGNGRLLITDAGARILGCALENVDHNLFWADLPATEENRAPVGGDRLWIAPEVAFFWPSLQLAREDPIKHSAVPHAIDPGDFERVAADSTQVSLAATIALTDSRDQRSIQLAVTRDIRAIDPPADMPPDLSAISFAITNTLTCQGGDPGAVAGTWDILQVPATGTIICPTTQRIDPTSYYNPFGPRHVQTDDHAVHFLVDAQNRIKMGIAPQHTLGRMAYYRPLQGDRATLIVRFFPTLPGEPYIDQPITADKDKRVGGDCLQAYNHHTGAQGFGELEYHDPGLIVGAGPKVRSGTCVTHVLAGDDTLIRDIGEQLLGVAIRPIT